MQFEKFNQLWNAWSSEWYKNATCDVKGNAVPVSELCTLKQGLQNDLWAQYEKSKSNVKKHYFYPGGDKLNKYKRASVITFVISSSTPLEYRQSKYEEIYDSGITRRMDPLFLKQRLAFFVGLSSILMDYNEEDVLQLPQPIFHFPKLTYQEESTSCDEVDDFLTSVYKDLFYSEIYHNRNVLALANMYWLIVSSSELSRIRPIDDSTF